MKTKPYSKKNLERDNIELTQQLNQAIASNVELRIMYDEAVEKNKKLVAYAQGLEEEIIRLNKLLEKENKHELR